MRTLNVVFEDEDYQRLEDAKGERTWREFLMDAAAKEVEKHELQPDRKAGRN
jgi:hypothetical protein